MFFKVLDIIAILLLPEKTYEVLSPEFEVKYQKYLKKKRAFVANLVIAREVLVSIIHFHSINIQNKLADTKVWKLLKRVVAIWRIFRGDE